MKSKFEVENYMITYFVKFFVDGNPIQLLDLLIKFVSNPYYDSKTPIARHSIADIFANTDRKYDYEYKCEVCDELLVYDRYSIQGRVAFFEMMRIHLPSYSIILENNKEIEVQAFLSIYNDGYCGITHLYPEIKMPLSKKMCKHLEYENDVKYIKLDRLFIELLNIAHENMDSEYNSIGISKDDFIDISEGNPFNIHIEIIARILEINDGENLKNNNIDEPNITYHGYIDTFHTYNISSDSIISDEEIKKIRIIIEELDDLYNFNYNVHAKLLDLSIDDNELILLSYKYLLFIKQPEYKAYNRRFIPMYATTEYFLNERCKLYRAQYELRNLDNYGDITQEQLIDFRNKYLDVIKMDVGYEFYRPEDAQLAEHIKQQLRINFLYDEIKKTFEKYFQINRLNSEIEEKSKHNSELRKERKFNETIQIFTLMLTIPAITQIVDILYTIEVKKIIFFPIGLAKLIWVSLTIIIIIIIFYWKSDKE